MVKVPDMIKSARSPFVALLILAITGVASAADGAPWPTDYAAAVKTAKAENKVILADFTGSDWCGWCIKLAKDTFAKPAFAEFAQENLVLLEVDFPQGKAQSDAVKKQNEALQQKYGVEGFPTLVLIDGNGNEIARHVGYLEGGPAAMIAWIKESTPKS